MGSLSLYISIFHVFFSFLFCFQPFFLLYTCWTSFSFSDLKKNKQNFFLFSFSFFVFLFISFVFFLQTYFFLFNSSHFPFVFCSSPCLSPSLVTLPTHSCLFLLFLLFFPSLSISLCLLIFRFPFPYMSLHVFFLSLKRF